MKILKDIEKRILSELKKGGKTEYFTVYSVKGEEIKIRVGDHSGNRINNGDTKTLSFTSNRSEQRKSAYNSMIEEWEVDLDSELTGTFQSIEEVLEWEEVSNDQEEAEGLFWDNY